MWKQSQTFALQKKMQTEKTTTSVVTNDFWCRVLCCVIQLYILPVTVDVKVTCFPESVAVGAVLLTVAVSELVSVLTLSSDEEPLFSGSSSSKKSIRAIKHVMIINTDMITLL